MSKKLEDLSSLTKEELIKKVLNQKESLFAANLKIKELSKRLEMFEIAISEKPIHRKVQICMEETLSYVEECSRLLTKLRSLGVKDE
ncbi:MAG: hypothetical protein IKI95_00440 [Clostridia bacterium]|nr:hypothetical protein [Clostridia bacterium]